MIGFSVAVALALLYDARLLVPIGFIGAIVCTYGDMLETSAFGGAGRDDGNITVVSSKAGIGHH
jgi:hypothetical protein